MFLAGSPKTPFFNLTFPTADNFCPIETFEKHPPLPNLGIPAGEIYQQTQISTLEILEVIQRLFRLVQIVFLDLKQN